jgi:hypothetical protein
MHCMNKVDRFKKGIKLVQAQMANALAYYKTG